MIGHDVGGRRAGVCVLLLLAGLAFPAVLPIGRLAFPGLAMAAAAEGYLSPVALVADKDGAHLYVAASGGRQVIVFDVAKRAVAKTIPLPDAPTGLALAPDGTKLYVTAGQVQVIDVGSGKDAASTLPAGYGPTAPVASPDGALLYVCNRFNNDVSVIDLATKAQAARIPVVREPVAAALTPDGKILVVANLLPAGPSDGDFISCAVSLVDTASKTVAATVALPNGSSSLRGVCVSPDGAYAYVTHILGRYHLPTTQLERGWMNTNALSVIDIAGRKLLNTVLLDDVDAGAANPWGVACSADGANLCVAHAGTHEVSVIDRVALHAKLAKVAAGEKVSEVSSTPEDVPNDLSFLVGIRRRLKLAGNGPRGLAIIGKNAYAAEYFTGTLGVVPLSPDVAPKAQSVALGSEPALSVARKGEMFFHDATLCFQQWQSCSSCHPDVRADGLNWDLLNDGMGNPKNTKSMLLAHKTPPSMALGVREGAEAAVRAGIRHIQFAVRPEEDAVAIDEFLKSLTPQPSPYLVDGKLGPAAERGKAVFQEAGCAVCHPEPLYTNLKQYNIGTGKGQDTDKAFDTPTLVEVWRTAPYLHDGRAATLKDVLTTANPDGKHGATSKLSAEQINDLAEFVLTR